jgi:serine phosphatase RsbU (regulator of sigma subunit)
MAKIHFSNLHSPDSDPAALLSSMHHQLKKIPLDANYLTGLYFLLKPDLTFQYAIACHMPGVIFRRSTGEISLLQGRGFLLGMDGPEIIDSISGKVARGDRILFFTDGLVEPSDESSSVFGTVQEVFLNSAHLPLTDCYDYLISNLINPHLKTTDDITFILLEIR